MSSSVIIVGGGVIGASCAYYLRQFGCGVTLIEQHHLGSGCSHANCGFVCPSHVLPLSSPSTLREGIVSLFRPNGSLRIAPRFDPLLWSWLWRFAQNSHPKRLLPSAHAIHALLQSSRRLFDYLIQHEAINCEWETRGILFVFITPKAFEHYATTADLLRREFSMNIRCVPSQKLLAFEPSLRPGLAGGWFFESDAHLKPDLLMSEWRRVLLSRGVEIVENTKVRDFETSGRRITHVNTNRGSFPADAVVLAAGAWSPNFSRHIGLRLPIQPGKGYSLTLPKPATAPSRPIILEEHRVAVTPFRTSYRIGSTMEFAGYDTSLPPRRLDFLKHVASRYLCEPLATPVLEKWYGWRPMTPDSLPIIDRSLRLSNLFVAAGHNMLGLSMAPATGQLIAELITGTAPHIDPSPYRLARFR
jgi:D-amino-acid dehydrogenase